MTTIRAGTDWNEDKDAFFSKPPVKGKLIEMGDLKSWDTDGSVHDYPKSILVQFDSVEDIRRALDEGICKFVW